MEDKRSELGPVRGETAYWQHFRLGLGWPFRYNPVSKQSMLFTLAHKHKQVHKNVAPPPHPLPGHQLDFASRRGGGGGGRGGGEVVFKVVVGVVVGVVVTVVVIVVVGVVKWSGLWSGWW